MQRETESFSIIIPTLHKLTDTTVLFGGDYTGFHILTAFGQVSITPDLHNTPRLFYLTAFCAFLRYYLMRKGQTVPIAGKLRYKTKNKGIVEELG